MNEKPKKGFVWLLALGVFGIINTEMGIIGILPEVAAQFSLSIVQAGYLVSFFALGVAIAGPLMPPLFAAVPRKRVMFFVLGMFLVSNIVSLLTTNFTVMLIARVIPAFFHPVYCAMAFSLAASTAEKGKETQAVAKVFMGVSAGMVVGVPISNFLASMLSLSIAFGFFAAVNALALLGTIFLVPNLPGEKRVAYGAQLGVLKHGRVLSAILAVILMNGAVFGAFNYLAEYIAEVTHLTGSAASALLFAYGVMNIVGSAIAGKLLAKHPQRTVVLYLLGIGFIYLLLSFTGHVPLLMVILTVLWGILGGINGNVTQYWLSHAVAEFPDFANGLFLTAANLGTVAGTMVGGVIIDALGIRFMGLVGILFALGAGLVIIWEVRAGKKEIVTV